MAEATRSRVSADRLEDAIAKLSAPQLAMNTKIDDLLQRMSQLEANQQPPRTPLSSSAGQTPTMTASASSHRLKLEVPRFDGSDPTGWTFKITQFFEYHATPDHERLTISSFYMEELALAWFQWMHRNAQLSSWPAFLHSLHTRFASSTYEDPTGLLCKLQQRTSVNAYLTEFESLANRIIGIPAQFVLSCFISGLTPAIRREVQVLQPILLNQAVAYARLQEEKLLDASRSSTQRFQTATIPTRSPSTNPTPPLLPAQQRTPNSSIPFKRLSPEELARRREKGLCFHCDEKFSCGHICSPSLFLLIAGDDEFVPDEDVVPELPLEPPEVLIEAPPAQQSLHALSGHSAPETLRMTGTIQDLQVSILIDRGSTHNFLHHKVVTALKLDTQDIAPLRVMVSNGEEIRCQQQCSNVTVLIQKHLFTIDFHILPLCGADVVLGVQWLKTLGPVLTDYTSLNMKFITGGKLIELRGDCETNLQHVTPSQLRRLLYTNPASTFYHVCINDQTTIQPASHSVPEATSLITRYSSLFQPPSSLPPSRLTDHSINLLPNTAPVNVKPY